MYTNPHLSVCVDSSGRGAQYIEEDAPETVHETSRPETDDTYPETEPLTPGKTHVTVSSLGKWQSTSFHQLIPSDGRTGQSRHLNQNH